jgi:hypothetical protein
MRTPPPPDGISDARYALRRAQGLRRAGKIPLVLGDVLDGYVSIEGAREDYGVVIDEQKLTVDQEATERLRAVGVGSPGDFHD